MASDSAGRLISLAIPLFPAGHFGCPNFTYVHAAWGVLLHKERLQSAHPHCLS